MALQPDLEQARHEVLVDNTAQAVHKHLSKLFSEESRFRSRWLWELFQNARDAAPVEGVIVWVSFESKQLTFRHTGLPFTSKNVAHLIYHGSTKHDLADDGLIGQFGTGFLTTHLLSREVTVKGLTDTGHAFCFQLNRRGDTADELKRAMDESWNSYSESLQVGPSSIAGFTTEYIYSLDEKPDSLVNDALGDLRANLAYVLGFNDRVVSVRISAPGRDMVMKVVERRKVAAPFNHVGVHVEERENNRVHARHVVIVSGDSTSVAVEIDQSDGRWTAIRQHNIPRLFVAFPLTAMRDFPLSVVINSEKFQPREDRDTLFLKPNHDGKSPNMNLIEEALTSATRLVKFAATTDWLRAPLLANTGELREWDWLDIAWFRSLVEDRFIGPLRTAPILSPFWNEEDREKAPGKIPPNTSMIPISTDEISRTKLWNLASKWTEIAPKLPTWNDSELWAQNVYGWASFLSKHIDEFDEALTLSKLCEVTTSKGTLKGVSEALVGDADVVAWLNDLYALILDLKRQDLLDQFPLVPNQLGDLKKLRELKQDGGIDENLKDIAENLGVKVRAELIDVRIDLNTTLTPSIKLPGEVLDSAMLKLQASKTESSRALRASNVALFIWLVGNGHLERLDGFPSLTRASTDAEPTLIVLQSPLDPDELPLAPTDCWPDAARMLSDFLAPKQHTLADDYYGGMNNMETWRLIEQRGFLRLSPLYTTQSHMPFIPDEPLPENETTQDHLTKDVVDVSALAFFEKDSAGLDAVRRSKNRASSLLLFLTEYVLKTAIDSLEPLEAECECGARHHYYPAKWLVPMWSRQWVPLGDGKQSSPTAEAIAQLFRNKEDQLRQLISGSGRLLLEALKISLADLSLRAVANDEDTRITLMGALTDIVQATGHDIGKVKLVAQEIREFPGLIDDINERRKIREKIRQNQSVGATVEKLLKELLEGFDFKVERTGVGSDYEVDQDYVEDGREIFLKIEHPSSSVLLEIKATLGDHAKMTPTQAQTAYDNKDRFALCVVHLPNRDITLESVRAGCRFITDIGSRISMALANYRRYQFTRENVCSMPGEVELVMTASEVRFAVTAELWKTGLDLDQAVAYLKSLR